MEASKRLVLRHSNGGKVMWMTGCRAGLQRSFLPYSPSGWAAVNIISCVQGGLDVYMCGRVVLLIMMVVLRMAVRSETGRASQG